MHRLFHLLLFLFSIAAISQDISTSEVPVDTEYREDQFYINVTYNIVTGAPDGVSLRGLSGGLGFGYIRDMPLNTRRNIAVGLGLGFAFNRYGQNLFIGEGSNENSIFSVLDGATDFDVNRFSAATIEVPFELRWRTSTPEDYKFWRVYIGVRLGYTFYYQSDFTQDNNSVSQTDISEFEPLTFAPTFSFGFNKINFFASYSITPFFRDAQTDLGEDVDFNPLKIGLIFYIL